MAFLNSADEWINGWGGGASRQKVDLCKLAMCKAEGSIKEGCGGHIHPLLSQKYSTNV